MRLGIDVSILSKGTNGIARVCLEVIEELKKTDIEIVLFSSSKIQCCDQFRNSIEIIEANLKSFVLKFLWTHLRLPYLLKKNRITFFWGPAHKLPLFQNKDILYAVTIHDMVWKKFPKTMNKLGLLQERLLTNIVLNKADLIISVSETTKKDIINFNPDLEEKIHTVPNGINTSKFIKLKFNKGLSSDIKKPYILFVGTIEPRKNIARLIESFSDMPEYIKEKYDLVICGKPGWGGISIDKLAKDHEVERSIKQIGPVDHNDLMALYSNAFCGILPSLYEGFGLTVLEFQTYGVPILVSNAGAIPEVAGEGALYFDPYNISEITSQMERLLTDKNLRKDLSDLGTLNIQRFNWEITSNTILALFKRAFCDKSSRRVNEY